MKIKPPKKRGVRYVRYFRHWRTGKIIRASDYGLKAFPIGRQP